MQGGGSKPEVFYGEALVEKLFEGGDTDLEVVVDEFLVHLRLGLGHAKFPFEHTQGTHFHLKEPRVRDPSLLPEGLPT